MPPQVFVLRMQPKPPCHEGRAEDWDCVPEGLEKNQLIIGWARAGGLLRQDLTRSDFRDIIQRAYGECYDRRRAGAAAGQAWRFIRDMNVGDLVVVPDGERFHIGRVAGLPWRAPRKVASNSAYRRDAEWLMRCIRMDGAKPDLKAAMQTKRTLSLVRDEVVAAKIREQFPIRPTKENLRRYAGPVLAQWLIREAGRGSSITYGQAKRRLETEIGFSTIHSIGIGVPAGHLMNRLLDARHNCPLLNILLVRQHDRMPGPGAGGYMADYLNRPEFREPGRRDEHPDEWCAASEAIAAVVYAFDEWDQIYAEAFGQPLPAPADPEGQEGDGFAHGGQGEGPNHRKLRLWVLANPGEIAAAYEDFRTETEVVLDSADRVDVVFFGSNETIAIEVKSADSNEADLRRGVFQCIKYRAVMEAMDIRAEPTITAILVTQERLPGDLAALARMNGVQHFLAPRL